VAWSSHCGCEFLNYGREAGYMEVLVYNADALAAVDVNTLAIRIGHTVGKRKRAEIIAKAKELNIKILNIKVAAEEAPAEEAEGEEAAAEGEEQAEKTEEKAEEKKKPKAKPKAKAKESKKAKKPSKEKKK
jgi:outer membrane biosynthesis protein TonB